MIISIALAALTIAAPKDGATMPTLRDAQKAYFAGPRAERFVRMDNAADRLKLIAAGATQKPLRLAWNGATNAVYELTIVAEGGEEESFALTNRTEIWVTNLELARKYRWMVRCEETGEFATAVFVTEPDGPRFLRAGGVGNFRDAGGWKTVDGRRVRQNMLFRSAGLRDRSNETGGFIRRHVELGARRITTAGIRTLREDFHIRTDMELRSHAETVGMVSSVLGDDVRWVAVPFAAYDFIDNLVRGREPFAELFRHLTKAENFPVLMHCSGGRDRTGTMVFMLNGLLGVSEDDLCKDWEASVFSLGTAGNFTSERIQRLLDYLKTLPGATLKERVESYVRGCGITNEEVAAFRAVMLE